MSVNCFQGEDKVKIPGQVRGREYLGLFRGGLEGGVMGGAEGRGGRENEYKRHAALYTTRYLAGTYFFTLLCTVLRYTPAQSRLQDVRCIQSTARQGEAGIPLGSNERFLCILRSHHHTIFSADITRSTLRGVRRQASMYSLLTPSIN